MGGACFSGDSAHAAEVQVIKGDLKSGRDKIEAPISKRQASELKSSTTGDQQKSVKVKQVLTPSTSEDIDTAHSEVARAYVDSLFANVEMPN